MGRVWGGYGATRGREDKCHLDEPGCPGLSRVYEVLRIGARVETMLVGVAT
jgi:hypothetical protein